jgi:dolichyl-phosphate beta-glucosyltransferase
MSLSLVIPCRNEEKRLPGTMREVQRWNRLTPSVPLGELILVIEPSTDDTLGVASHLAATMNDLPIKIVANKRAGGKGFAVRTGLLQATQDVVLFMDADGSVPLEFIRSFYLPIIRDRADLCLASRRCPESLITTPQPLRRELAGRLFNFIMRIQGFARFSDTQCGFKSFSRSAAHTLAQQYISNQWSFDVELLYLAQRAKMRLLEIPVEWGDKEGSKLGSLGGAVPSLWETSVNCWKHRFGLKTA